MGRVAMRPSEKRLLRLVEAAEYCGVSPSMFERVCPVRPISLGDELRWGRESLDEWMADGRRHPPMDGPYVYAVGFGAYIKIGYSARPIETRLATLQCGCPERLTVYGRTRGTKWNEERMHAKFAAYRLEGEWFRNEGAVAAWIEKGCPL